MELLNQSEIIQLENYYVKRLVQSWIDYKQLIIYVDFDNTLIAYDSVEQKLITNLVAILQKAKVLGAHLSLYTCRDGQRLQEALTYCQQLNLHFDSVNQVGPFADGYSIKPFYNILLDDRAGLYSATQILIKAVNLYEKWINEIPINVSLTRNQIKELLSEYETDN